MSIEVGSKWVHKDGGVYTVFVIEKFRIDNITLIWYTNQQEDEEYVRTEKHFLESFKSYEDSKPKTIIIDGISYKLEKL